MEAIYKRIISESTYDRLRDLNENGINGCSYHQFIAANKGVIKDLPKAELDFLVVLCDKFRTGMILSLDAENCVEMSCDGFYYTSSSKLVIVTPR
jgi:hypothetical protein